MDSKALTEYIKQQLDEEDDEAITNGWRNRHDYIKKEQHSIVRSNINIADIDYEDPFDNHSKLADVLINDQLDTLHMKSEIFEMKYENNYTEFLFKQEHDDIVIKDEIDIEYDAKREEISYSCDKCDFKSEFNCSYQKHMDTHNPIIELSRPVERPDIHKEISSIISEHVMHLESNAGGSDLKQKFDEKFRSNHEQNGDKNVPKNLKNELDDHSKLPSFLHGVLIKYPQEDTLDVKMEILEMGYEKNYLDLSFNQENDDFCDIKDEIDIECNMEKEKTSYSCDKCDFKSELYCSYQVHIDNDHENISSSISEHVKHLESNEGNSEQRQKCIGLIQNNDEDKSMKCAVKEKFECKICHKNFNLKQSLYYHTKSIHDQTQYKCQICHKIFNQQRGLRKHVKAIHDQIRYKCESCHKTFRLMQNLYEHVKSFHDKIRHSCKVCHKIFSHRKTLSYHLKTIHNEKKYKCDVCHKMFHRKQNLVKHVHNETKHECEFCLRIFNHKGSLDRHVKKMHEDIELECIICHKIFDCKRYLVCHVKTAHSINKPECEFCHKTFNYKQSLDRHVKAIHENIKYKCDSCHRIFRHKQSLCHHVKEKH